MIRARSFATIVAAATVVVMTHGTSCTITGGIKIQAVEPKTAQEWCDLYGVPVENGKAILFKAVNDEFKSGYKFPYMPGTTPRAPDWDGGFRECGRGLHWVPRPWMGKKFFREATKYIGAPVALSEIAVHRDADHPDKVKSAGACGPVFECDEDGKPLPAPESPIADSVAHSILNSI